MPKHTFGVRGLRPNDTTLATPAAPLAAKSWLDLALLALAAVIMAAVVSISGRVAEAGYNAAPAPAPAASSPVLPAPLPAPPAPPKPLAPRNRQERRHGRLPPIHGCPYMAAWWAKVNREATLWLLKKHRKALIARIRKEIEREKARAVVARENKVRELESLVFPTSRSVWTWPRAALTLAALAALAALYLGFGAEGVAMGVAVGGLDPLPDAVGDDAAKVLPKVTPFSKLGMALASIKRRMGHLPMATATILPGGDGAPKVIFATNGRDNIGLLPFADAFGLQPLGEQDILLIEANGAPQETINAVAAAFIEKGYRPVGTRMMIRAFGDNAVELPGADYIRAIDTFLGSAVDVRSYFSLGAAPALSTFSVKDKITTEREGELDGKEVLWFTGKAGKIFPGLDGTEGGLPISEKAMEALFGSKNPGQPRFVVRLNDTIAALVKGNFSPIAVRAFEDSATPCGYKFLARGHFGNDEAGEEAWRRGHDFVFIEDDTPKGRGKDALKTGEIKLFDPVNKVSGWLIAQAKNEQGRSLVSYQVLALIADSAGLKTIANHIRDLVSGSVIKSIAQVKSDLDKMEIPGVKANEMEDFKNLLSAMAPGSARATRKNHLGFGAEVWTGYIHMNTLINKGVIVVGDGFGLNKRAMDARRKNLKGAEDACGGKNPILDHQQTWVGKLVRLCEVQDLAKGLATGSLNPKQQALAEVLWGTGKDANWMGEQVKWLMAFAPALTRGSIVMNADDVADLAGDDDGDQLWFSFGNEKILSVFQLIKEQARGTTPYAIENNKKAQLPSEVGTQDFNKLLTLKGSDLAEFCQFIMAPNKGQGPVGYMANICTILISTFPKVVNAQGGMSYANIWVERLQAALNLMQQTSIDMQKRLYATICLMRWTLGNLEKARLNGRGLVPGFDFPGLGYDFNSSNGFDPASFTPAQYKAALKAVEMPNIPCHWTGASIPLCTSNDSQYSIRAIGSWLIWECLSLIATGKPAAWGDEMAQDAKGGLNPLESLKYIGENGPDVEEFIKTYRLDDKAAAAVRNVWQKSPSTLYSWKTQGKDEAFAVKAPPAIEMNHEIARGIKAAQKPAKVVEVDFDDLNREIEKLINISFSSTTTACTWVSKLLDGFYLEAAMANNNKATSERFQTSEERSGVEALSYLLEALDNAFTTQNGATAADIKAADGFKTALNPREKFDNRKKVVGAFVALLTWWSMEHGEQEWVDILQPAITPPEGSRDAKYKIAMQKYGILEADAKTLVKAKEAKKLAPETMSLIKRLVAEHHNVNAEKLEAKTTWLVDDGLSAAVVALENTELIMAKRDVLKEVQEAVKRWTDRREGWDESRVGVEILLASTGWFAAKWFESHVTKLEEMVKGSTRAVSEIRKDVKDKSKTKEQLAQLKAELKAANNAADAKALLALKGDNSVGYVTLLDAFCSPRQNPLASEFVDTMLTNSGPIVNVERAWQRADQQGSDKKNVKDWTWELGDWVTRKGKGTDPNGEPRRSKTYLYAHSRVEWALSDKANADFSRALLSAGVSHYKLAKVPAQSYKTWRYWDAVVYAEERTENYSLVHGVGHLISEAIPTQKAKDQERYRRMAHLGHLAWALQAWKDAPADRNAANFRDTLVGYHEIGLATEITRVEALKDSALMLRWGHLWAPVSWGMQVHTWGGKLTQKAINGRAWAALAQLGKHDARYHDQPTVLQVVNGQPCYDASKELKPLSSNGKLMPFKRSFAPKGQSNELARAYRAVGVVQGELDDTEDLVPFTFGDLDNIQVSYKDWLGFIEPVAVGGDASALVLAGLWFGAHSGRISALNPNNKDIYSAEIAEKIKRRLLRCPAYEVRLHIEDMFGGQHIAPVAKKVDASAARAFFTTIRKIAGLID